MRQLSTREIVLVTGLAIVGVVMGIQYLGGGGLGGGGGIDVDNVNVGEAPVVNMARLSLDLESYDPNGRDLFKYGSPPAAKRPPAPPPRPVTTQRPTVRQPTRPTDRAKRAQDRTPPKPQAPKPEFKYLGHLGPKDNWIAVLEDEEELKTIQVGEKINDNFRLRGFKYNAVVVDYVDAKWKDLTAEVELKTAGGGGGGRRRR